MTIDSDVVIDDQIADLIRTMLNPADLARKFRENKGDIIVIEFIAENWEGIHQPSTIRYWFSDYVSTDQSFEIHPTSMDFDDCNFTWEEIIEWEEEFIKIAYLYGLAKKVGDRTHSAETYPFILSFAHLADWGDYCLFAQLPEFVGRFRKIILVDYVTQFGKTCREFLTAGEFRAVYGQNNYAQLIRKGNMTWKDKTWKDYNAYLLLNPRGDE